MSGPWEDYKSDSAPWEDYSPAQSPMLSEPEYAKARAQFQRSGGVSWDTPYEETAPPNKMLGILKKEAIPLAMGAAGSFMATPVLGAAGGYVAGKAMNRAIGIEEPATGAFSSDNGLIAGSDLASAAVGAGIGKGLQIAAPAARPLISKIPGAESLIAGATTDIGPGFAGRISQKAAAAKQFYGDVENRVIDKAINAIRPTVSGRKNSPMQRDIVQNQNRDAFKNIIAEKNDLVANEKPGFRFSDDTGAIYEKALPENLTEMIQANSQTMKAAAERWQPLLMQAEDRGVKIDYNPLADALEAEGKRLLNSNIVSARSRAGAYMDQAKAFRGKTVDPFTAEQDIEYLNNVLKPMFRDGTFANSMEYRMSRYIRESTDDAVSKLGNEFQEYKNVYSAGKSLEKDLLHRDIVDKRKNPKGLLDFTDIMTSGEIVGGALSGNPAMMAKGIAGRLVKNKIKDFNNIDRTIAKTFKQLDAISTRKGALGPRGYMPEGEATVEVPFKFDPLIGAKAPVYQEAYPRSMNVPKDAMPPIWQPVSRNVPLDPKPIPWQPVSRNVPLDPIVDPRKQLFKGLLGD